MDAANEVNAAKEVISAIACLRERHFTALAPMPQSKVVEALAALADRWRNPGYALRREAETWREPFPFPMVEVSLNALLDSLEPDALWALIDDEGVRDAVGYPVVGHVIAANTPLLSWVSIIRALLVRSASFVKLPSGPAAHWGRIFVRSLAEVSPELALCVHLAQWPGGTIELEAALCQSADIVMAHGSDKTIRDLSVLCPETLPFVGYGHRISFGLVTREHGTLKAAEGFCKDVLLYDQGGCLSPQTIFVEGGWNETLAFAGLLAEAMPKIAACYPLPLRTAQAAMVVRESRGIAEMGEGNHLWADGDLRWTVIARPESDFALSPTYGIVSVQPLASLQDLPEALGAVAGYLQGCAVAGEGNDYLPSVSRMCKSGELQSPPLSWRQDGRDVLRLLLPPAPNNGGARGKAFVPILVPPLLGARGHLWPLTARAAGQ